MDTVEYKERLWDVTPHSLKKMKFAMKHMINGLAWKDSKGDKYFLSKEDFKTIIGKAENG